MERISRSELLRECSKKLSVHSFIGRDRLFVRKAAEPGLTHVIGLEVGKGAVSGLFRINLGIWIEEAHFARTGEASAKVSDYGSQVRIPLTALTGIERWGWPLDEDASIVKRILDSGLDSAVTFFDSHDSRRAIVDEDWSQFGPRAFGLDLISRAAILAHTGRTQEAIENLREELRARSKAPKGSGELVLAAAKRMHLSGIAD